jgi:hypothetical protein
MKQAAAIFLAALLAAAPAHAVSLGASVFGGASIPIVQDDTGSGSQFGIRIPISVVPLFSVEPYFAHSGLGDASETLAGFEYSRTGFDVNTYGVNIALGSFGMLPGFPLYPYVGIGSNKLTRDGSSDISEVGYNFGLGVGFGIPPGVTINLRGEINAVATGDTSRKFANINVAVGYNFFHTP